MARQLITSIPIRRAALATLLAALLATTPAATQTSGDDELPELGDSAARVLSPARERAIGQQFHRQIIQSNTYISDPELNHYLNRLGDHIAEHASLRGTPITIHLIEEESLNAFAVPGGHITLHTGLILAAADESELAAVVAHEIAHISQRHLPRMLAKAQAGALPAAATLLASLLVGGQAGLAGFTLANAALLSNQLAYTRDFEREADSIGIQLLADSGYDPNAMALFFNKLERSGLGSETPDFLRTHPLSYTRTAAAESRASAYPPRDHPPSRAFYLAQAKIRVLSARENEEIEAALGHFRDQLADGELHAEQHLAATYGIALIQRKMRQYDAARATLQPLLDAHPREAAFQLARAAIDLAAADPSGAAARLAQLAEIESRPAYLTSYQAEALLAAGDAAGAKRVVRHQLRRRKDLFTLYPLLSKSNVRLGLPAEAHQADAEYYAALGDYRAAEASLTLALREAGAEDGYLYQSIAARLKQIEEQLNADALK